MGIAPIERQVAPQRTAQLGMADADTFGAATGRAIGALGASLQDYDLVQRELKRNEENAAAGRAFADYRVQATKDVQTYRDNANPGADEHEGIVENYLDTNGNALLDHVSDQRVREHLSAQVTEFNAGLKSREILWQGQQRVAKLGTDEKAAQTSSFDRITTAASLADASTIIAEEREAGHARIEAYTGVSEDDRAAMTREFDKGLQRSTLGLATRVDPKSAQAMLDRGAFNDLNPDELEQGYRAVGVEQRREAAAAAHQAAMAKADAREQLATLSARVATGEEVPAADLAKGAALARSIGDDSGAVRLRADQIRLGVNRETKPWTPAQFTTRIQQLRARGDKRNADQDIELRQLETLAPSRATEFRKDPGSWAALNGNPPPALNPGDAISIAARRRWQSTVSDTTGLPTPFLQPDEVSAYQSRLAESPRARIDVANELANLGGMTAVWAARQVAPEDALLARIVTLRPGDRAAVANGAEARKAMPGLVDGKAGNEARALFLQRVGPAARLMGQGDVAAAFDVARNLYADAAAKNGYQSFEPSRWNVYIHRALGGTKDAEGQYHGGVGTYNGANVLLPSRLSQGQFEAVMTRMNWRPDDGPAWRDGRAMTPADVRKFTPVARPDGRYEFHGPGDTVLQGRNGGVWSLDVASLGARYIK